jgi:exonuclease III
MDSSDKKYQQKKLKLNYIMDQMELTDIFRTFHPTAAEYIFFSLVHGTFCRIHNVRSQTSLNKLKKKS